MQVDTAKTIFTEKYYSINSSISDITLFTKQYIPTSKSKVLYNFVIVHDLGGHHGRYQELVNFLMNKPDGKFMVSVFDLMGHGQSNGSRTYINSFEDYCMNLIDFLNFKEVNNDSVKTVLLGHGLGGLVILKTLEQYSHLIQNEIDGIILSNPLIKLNFNLPFWSKILLAPDQNKLENIRHHFEYNGYDLTNDPSLAEHFNADYLVSNFATLNLIYEIQAAAKEVRSYSYFVDIPSLFLVSSESCLTSISMVELFQKGMPKQVSTINKYNNFKHDILHEVDRVRVFKDVYSWISQLT